MASSSSSSKITPEKRCFLRPVDDSLNPIELFDGMPRTLGRGPLTRIKDSKCSRIQIELMPDISNNKVLVSQLGKSPCCVNGKDVQMKQSQELYYKDTLEIFLGKPTYILDFDPPPDSGVGQLNIAMGESAAFHRELPPPPKLIRMWYPTAKNKIKHELWEEVDNDLLIYRSVGSPKTSKVAAFDLNGTLIAPHGEHSHPQLTQDWKILYLQVSQKLTTLSSQGFKICVFTNELDLQNLSNTSVLVRSFQEKIEKIVEKLNVPMEVYIGKSDGLVKKPCLGMWHAMMIRNGDIPISDEASFYCGDNAGRVYQSGLKDASQEDILFAKNLKLPFFTPELYFLGRIEQHSIEITAFSYSSLSLNLPLCSPLRTVIASTRKELVVLTGCSGSGKTTFINAHMLAYGYKVVTSSLHGSLQKCLEAADYLLSIGHKVVVDDDNPTFVMRIAYGQLAQSKRVPYRIFIMDTPRSLARHNNRFRQLFNQYKFSEGEAAINMYFTKYEEVQPFECSAIVKINFWPMFQGFSPKQVAVYKQYICDK